MARTGTGVLAHWLQQLPMGEQQKGSWFPDAEWGSDLLTWSRFPVGGVLRLLASVWDKRFAAAVVSPHQRESGQSRLLCASFPLRSVSETVTVLFGAIHNVLSNLLTALGFVCVHQREVRPSVANAP